MAYFDIMRLRLKRLCKGKHILLLGTFTYLNSLYWIGAV